MTGRAQLSSRRLCQVIVLFGLLTIPPVSAAAAGDDTRYYQFATTQSYLAASETMRTGYVAGLTDSGLAFKIFPESTASCLSVMRLREIRAGFDRWLRNHPVEWRFSLPSNFAIAMRDLCE